MPDIKKLSLKLKSGLLTELHSDIIFGHFCWRLKELSGEEKLKEFIQLYAEGKPVFTISDGFQERGDEVFFPKPLISTPFMLKGENKRNRINSFLKHKEAKSRNLITVEQLNYFLKGDFVSYDDSFESPHIKEIALPVLNEDLRVSVEIDRETFASKEHNLFSYHPVYTEPDATFAIFVKITDPDKYEDYQCENILKAVFEIGYGKKKSSGYGEFKVVSFSDYTKFSEPDEPNGFIVLGNYLKSPDDKCTDGFYETNVKYGKLGEELSQSPNPFKSPIILFTAGSCFFTDQKKEFYGRITDESEISPVAFVRHFGTPFTLNIFSQAANFND